MRTPWFREFSWSWYVTKGKKQITLGKHPFAEPPEKNKKGEWIIPDVIQKAWHKAGAKEPTGKAKDMAYSDVVDRYAGVFKEDGEKLKLPKVGFLKNSKTAKDTRWFLDLFLAHVGDIKVSELRVHHVTSFLDTRTRWNSTTQYDCIERIVASLNWAVDQGLVDDHRVRYQRGRKPKRIKRVVVIADKHLDALEGAANANLRAILRCLRITGARPNELCTATIDRVNLKQGTMEVLNKTRVKTLIEYRTLFLSTEAREIVRQAIGDRTEGNVFKTIRGSIFKPTSISHEVRLLRIKLKLPKDFVPYGLRHTWASNSINKKGVNVAHAARLMGHVDISQMSVYFHEDKKAMKEAAEKAAK